MYFIYFVLDVNYRSRYRLHNLNLKQIFGGRGYKVEDKLNLGIREQKKKVAYHWPLGRTTGLPFPSGLQSASFP
jgi:hypothetical protein